MVKVPSKVEKGSISTKKILLIEIEPLSIEWQISDFNSIIIGYWIW